MKNVFSLLLIFFATPSMAAKQASDEVQFFVDYRISACAGENTISCNVSPSIGSNIKILIGDCEPVPWGTDCYGTWNTQIVREGFSFDAAVEVMKRTIKASEGDTISYTIEAKLNTPYPSGLKTQKFSNREISFIPYSKIGIKSENGQVKDDLMLGGNFYLIKNAAGVEVTYSPYLVIKPLQKSKH